MATATFVIPLADERFIVYAPLRRTAFVANRALVDAVAAAQAGHPPAVDPDGRALAQLLAEWGLASGAPADGPAAGRLPRRPPRPTEVTLLLTTACTLRCTYCYASAGQTPVQRMSFDVAARGIRFVLANAREVGAPSITVGFHGGGEPTANWRVMTGSLAYARREADERGVGVVATAATNGVLTGAQVDWIVENLDGGVTLSFDGLPEVHDRHRVTPDGRGSSAAVMRTMARFDTAGYGYGVRLTVTAEHVARLPASVEFICSRFRPGHIQVEPAYRLGRWREAPGADPGAFVSAFRDARAIAACHGRELDYSAARAGLGTIHFCGVSQDNFCLSPDGNVTACYEAFSETDPLADVFFYGRPAPGPDGYTFDAQGVRRLRRRTVDQLAWCRGCFARWDCAGDCAYKALAQAGRGSFRGSARCEITRELTKDQILAFIHDAGGVVWHDPARPVTGEGD